MESFRINQKIQDFHSKVYQTCQNMHSYVSKLQCNGDQQAEWENFLKWSDEQNRPTKRSLLLQLLFRFIIEAHNSASLYEEWNDWRSFRGQQALILPFEYNEGFQFVSNNIYIYSMYFKILYQPRFERQISKWTRWCNSLTCSGSIKSSEKSLCFVAGKYLPLILLRQ